MRYIKKVVSVISILTLLSIMSLNNVYANTYTEDGTGDMEVTATVDSSYTVCLPAVISLSKIVIDSDEKAGYIEDVYSEYPSGSTQLYDDEIYYLSNIDHYHTLGYSDPVYQLNTTNFAIINYNVSPEKAIEISIATPIDIYTEQAENFFINENGETMNASFNMFPELDPWASGMDVGSWQWFADNYSDHLLFSDYNSGLSTTNYLRKCDGFDITLALGLPEEYTIADTKPNLPEYTDARNVTRGLITVKAFPASAAEHDGYIFPGDTIPAGNYSGDLLIEFGLVDNPDWLADYP